MSDTGDGSRAAQSAQELDESGQRGLFGRLLEAFSPQDEDDGEPPRAERPALALRNLRRMRVEDVMIPKADVVAVPVDIGKSELVEVFRESGFSRVPVYKETLDHPLGLLLLKDFALECGFNGSGNRLALRKLLRPLLFVPPSMPLSILLQKMQTERSHMALVIDEYGGVDGLVTIEDLIEQVIGDISDEHDTAEDGHWTQEKPGVYLALAKADLEEFEGEIGMDLSEPLEDEEADTLGGLVFVLAGRVPARGEVIPHPAGVQFEVVDADPRRIKRLRVRLPGATPAL